MASSHRPIRSTPQTLAVRLEDLSKIPVYVDCVNAAITLTASTAVVGNESITSSTTNHAFDGSGAPLTIANAIAHTGEAIIQFNNGSPSTTEWVAEGWDGSNDFIMLQYVPGGGTSRPFYIGNTGASSVIVRTNNLDRMTIFGSGDASFSTSVNSPVFNASAVVAYTLTNGSAIRNTGASTSTTYMDLGVAVFRDSFAGSLANHAVVAVAGNIVANQNGLVAWAGGTDPTGAITTAFSQDSANVLDLGNGNFGDKSGTLNLAAVNATGTVTVGALALPRGKPVVTADKVVTPTTVTNTTTETTIYTFSVPGNTLGTTGSMRLTLCGNLSSALVSPGTYTVRVYYGATSFALVNGATLGSGDTNAAVRIVVDLSAGNATNAQLVNASYDDNSGAVGSVSNFQVRGPASEDSTAAKTFKVTVQFGSASLSNTFVTEFAHTELLQ